MRSANEVRQQFIDFFVKKHGHTFVPSSPVGPHDDPTRLFANAGMNQFKDVFLGTGTRPYKRAANTQKCIRAGGKHNDLDDVGKDTYHHTFFEMLGNWSFGDYFKREAIRWSWELLTAVYKLPVDRLWVTVYQTDDEAYDAWANDIGVPRERIVRIGDNKGAPYASDNFWQMADTGPCGPCSEIFYDHGPDIPGGPPGSAEAEGDRYVEIWNLVFMQFDRDAAGTLTPLPKPCVDTGMGLERLAAVLQGVHSNHDTDLFVPLMKRAAELCGSELVLEDKVEEGKGGAASLRVIADHSRATTFLINDGVLPSNEGRGYVLRKIMRRAIRHGYLLGMSESFLDRMVDSVCDLMKDAYPELTEPQSRTSQVVLSEEKHFRRTIQLASEKLDELIRSARADDTKTCLNPF